MADRLKVQSLNRERYFRQGRVKASNVQDALEKLKEIHPTGVNVRINLCPMTCVGYLEYYLEVQNGKV